MKTGDLAAIDRNLFVRRCVSCGYDGRLLRTPSLERCPRCGEDLTRRPPRSYAEMEGLIGQPVRLAGPSRVPRDYYESRVIQRWIMFLFVVCLGLIAFSFLAASALP